MMTIGTPGGRAVSRGEWCAVVAIVVFAAVIRLTFLDRVPPAMNQDEVLRGYDAWSLWGTGADYRGVRWPAYLEAFGPGEYVSAATAYLSAPFVGILGLEPWVVRLPFALAGTATVLLLWGWVRREAGPLAGLGAMVSLCLSPWHIQISRMAFEGDLTPCLVTIGMLGLVRGTQPRIDVARVVGGMALGAAMWVYPAARLVVPLLVAAWFAIEWRQRVWGGGATLSLRRAWTVAFGAMLIGAAPMLMTLIRRPGELLARAQNVGLFGSDLPLADALGRLVRQYFAHFDPVRLFIKGEGRAHQYPPDVGFLHWYEAVPYVAGIIWLIINLRHSTLARFLLVWMLLYPLPAALTRGGGPQMIRSIMGLPLLAVIAGLGFAAIVRLAGRASRHACIGAVAAGAAACSINAAYYAHYYFRKYPAVAARAFNTELAAAFTWVRERGEPYDAGLFAFPANQPFAYYLFFTRMEPARAQSAAVERVPWMIGFEAVVRYDRFFFCPPQLGRPMSEAELVQAAAALPGGTRILLIALPGQVQRTRPAAVTGGTDGGDMVEIHRWTSNDARGWLKE